MHVSSCLPLDHLDCLTDSTGLIQHAIYSIPRRESGYTTDDNARALRLCTRLWVEHPDERMLRRLACYLSFLEHARCPVRGFHNFLSYQRYWLDAGGTGDCQGEAVLGAPHALVECVGRWGDEAFRRLPETSFGFHDLVTTTHNVFWPIGNRDWYSHGEEKSLFHQQPDEAATMAAAALAGLELRADEKYLA